MVWGAKIVRTSVGNFKKNFKHDVGELKAKARKKTVTYHH